MTVTSITTMMELMTTISPTATVPAAPGAEYLLLPSPPRNSVRFRVFPFPPRPFFPKTWWGSI